MNASFDELFDSEVAVNIYKLRDAARLGLHSPSHRRAVYRYLLGVAMADRSREMKMEKEQEEKFQELLATHRKVFRSSYRSAAAPSTTTTTSVTPGATTSTSASSSSAPGNAVRGDSSGGGGGGSSTAAGEGGVGPGDGAGRNSTGSPGSSSSGGTGGGGGGGWSMRASHPSPFDRSPSPSSLWWGRSMSPTTTPSAPLMLPCFADPYPFFSSTTLPISVPLSPPPPFSFPLSSSSSAPPPPCRVSPAGFTGGRLSSTYFSCASSASTSMMGVGTMSSRGWSAAEEEQKVPSLSWQATPAPWGQEKRSGKAGAMGVRCHDTENEPEEAASSSLSLSRLKGNPFSWMEKWVTVVLETVGARPMRENPHEAWEVLVYLLQEAYPLHRTEEMQQCQDYLARHKSWNESEPRRSGGGGGGGGGGGSKTTRTDRRVSLVSTSPPPAAAAAPPPPPAVAVSVVPPPPPPSSSSSSSSSAAVASEWSGKERPPPSSTKSSAAPTAPTTLRTTPPPPLPSFSSPSSAGTMGFHSVGLRFVLAERWQTLSQSHSPHPTREAPSSAAVVPLDHLPHAHSHRKGGSRSKAPMEWREGHHHHHRGGGGGGGTTTFSSSSSLPAAHAAVTGASVDFSVSSASSSSSSSSASSSATTTAHPLPTTLDPTPSTTPSSSFSQSRGRAKWYTNIHASVQTVRENHLFALAALQLYYSDMTLYSFLYQVVPLTFPLAPLFSDDSSAKELFFASHALLHLLRHPAYENILRDGAARQRHCGVFMTLFRVTNPTLYRHFYWEEVNVADWVPAFLTSLGVGFLQDPENVWRLWDYYMADAFTHHAFPLHPYVCLSLLTALTEKLIEWDREEILFYLHHIPSMDMTRVLRHAVALQESSANLL